MVGAPPQKFDFVYICEIFQTICFKKLPRFKFIETTYRQRVTLKFEIVIYAFLSPLV